MEPNNNAYSVVLEKPVQLIAIVRGRPNPKLATIDAKPEDWHGGHPMGAVLMKEVELDCSAMTKPPVIEGWRVVHGDEVISDELLPSPIRLEPQVTMRLERCAIVRRQDAPANPAQAA